MCPSLHVIWGERVEVGCIQCRHSCAKYTCITMPRRITLWSHFCYCIIIIDRGLPSEGDHTPGDFTPFLLHLKNLVCECMVCTCMSEVCACTHILVLE